MFDNTKTVSFDEKVYDKILAINSQEGENVPLEEPVLAQVCCISPYFIHVTVTSIESSEQVQMNDKSDQCNNLML